MLSAIEGLGVATPQFTPFIVPITCVVLIGLFAVQSRGTGGIGRVFGPIMIVWFTTIGALGVFYISRYPSILGALLPTHALRFCVAHGTQSFVVLGSVVLAITGGEALYADMGHFGRGPIRLAWYALVLPALVLNYFGQGALLIADPSAAANPFFAMVPSGVVTYALVVLSAAATVIASQALISGAFSLTQQAILLGYLPRLSVRHTSSATEGQIYVPVVNWGLMIACVALVLGFRESSRLAAAYGIAVTGTMAITSVVFFVVMRTTWKWPLAKALPLLILFLSWDLPFFGSNLLKFVDGGYVPILVGVAFFGVMMIWRRGRTVLAERLVSVAPPMEQFMARLDEDCRARVPGTCVFLTAQQSAAPPVLVNYVRRVKSLPERVVLLTLVTDHVPRVPLGTDAGIEPIGRGIYRGVVHSGFMEEARVAERLKHAIATAGLELNLDDATYYLGRETFLQAPGGEMGRFTETVFAFLHKNASAPYNYFGLPAEQVVEIGMLIDL